jgi:hypothetical protein
MNVRIKLILGEDIYWIQNDAEGRNENSPAKE